MTEIDIKYLKSSCFNGCNQEMESHKMKFTKKLIVVLTVLALCVSLCACGGSDEMEAFNDFPAYTAEFQKVTEQVSVNTPEIKHFLGYAVAAYEAYDAKTFCKYVLEDLDYRVFVTLYDAVGNRAVEISREMDQNTYPIAAELFEFNKELGTINLGISNCNVQYAGYLESGVASDADYETLRNRLVFNINSYSQLLYGCDLLVSA